MSKTTGTFFNVLIDHYDWDNEDTLIETLYLIMKIHNCYKDDDDKMTIRPLS